MIKPEDYTKYLNDLLVTYKVDTDAMNDAYKSSAAFGEKLSKVAIEAAEKSNELAAKWTKETLSKMGSVTEVKDEPADYTKAVTEFASAQAEVAAENMAAFAEIAKKVQMETVELMLAVGQDFQKEATTAVKKASPKKK